MTSPRKLLVGHFDLLFVMVYGYPLLIIALTYNLLATEREEGTLALVLAQPIRLRTLVAAKIALRGALNRRPCRPVPRDRDRRVDRLRRAR